MQKTFLFTVIAISSVLNLVTSASAQIGAVWKKANVPSRQWNAIASSADGTKLIAGSHEGDVYISSDAGTSWSTTNFSVAINANALAVSANGAILVVAPSEGGDLRVSTDGGATWTPRGGYQNWAAVACSSNGTKMVAVVAGGQIYTSTDTGVTWTPRGPGQGWTAVTSSADGSKLVAVVRDGSFYISSDSGVNWEERAYQSDWTALASSADGSKLVAVLEFLDLYFDEIVGAISTSGNSGVGWSDPMNTQNGLTFTGAASSSDGTRLAICASNKGSWYPPGLVLVSTNSGSSWENTSAPIKWWTGVASSADGSKLAATYARQNSFGGSGGIYTYAEPSTNTPALSIAVQAGTAYLSWPWPSTGFVLEQNSNLATTNWVAIPGTPAVVNQVLSTPTNSSNFYRLHKQ